VGSTPPRDARVRASDGAWACVLGFVGLDVGGESIPSIADWAKDRALDAIRAHVQTINTIAHRIEDILAPNAQPAAEAIAAKALAA